MSYEFELKYEGEVIAHGGMTSESAIRLLIVIMNQKVAESGEVKHIVLPPRTKDVGPKPLVKKCSNCGGIGHNVKTCPHDKEKGPEEQSTDDDDDDEEQVDGLVNAKQFDLIQACKSEGMTMFETAAELSVPMREVRKVFNSNSYAQYRKE